MGFLFCGKQPLNILEVVGLRAPTAVETCHWHVSKSRLSNPTFGAKKQQPSEWMAAVLAEKVGFEPTWRVTANSISSQSRYPDFEGKRRKLTDNARVCKPLKNQHFSALEGRKSRKPRQSKEFERNPVLGRKKPVGEKMGRTRGEITVQCR